jgi:hypothetical protein
MERKKGVGTGRCLIIPEFAKGLRKIMKTEVRRADIFFSEIKEGPTKFSST